MTGGDQKLSHVGIHFPNYVLSAKIGRGYTVCSDQWRTVLLHQLFKEPATRKEACKAFQARDKPVHRLRDIHNPNSSKLYRLDDLPQVIYDPNQKRVINRFLQKKYPQLQAQVRQAFSEPPDDLDKKASVRSSIQVSEESIDSKLQHVLSAEFKQLDQRIEQQLQKMGRQLEEAIEEMQQIANKRRKFCSFF